MSREAMKRIKTWSERCEEHPDHQERIITARMIQERMQEEIDELRQALETEQEPVAWISEGGDVSRSKRFMDEMGFKCNPLYTAPPKKPWVELTDEEIYATYDEAESLVNASWANGFGTVGLMFPIAFYGLLEAKLKERNG